jgi:hypothetical protein
MYSVCLGLFFISYFLFVLNVNEFIGEVVDLDFIQGYGEIVKAIVDLLNIFYLLSFTSD